MGKLYGEEYFVEDFWNYCSILGALDRYYRNEDLKQIACYERT